MCLPSLRDDDDINDVASMAGVNLTEESANILATNSALVGTVTRSCKDETFLSPSLLSLRALEIGEAHGRRGGAQPSERPLKVSPRLLCCDREEVWRRRAGARRGQLHLPRRSAAAAGPAGESVPRGAAEEPNPQGDAVGGFIWSRRTFCDPDKPFIGPPGGRAARAGQRRARSAQILGAAGSAGEAEEGGAGERDPAESCQGNEVIKEEAPALRSGSVVHIQSAGRQQRVDPFSEEAHE